MNEMSIEIDDFDFECNAESITLNDGEINKSDSDDLVDIADEKGEIEKIKTRKKLIKFSKQHYKIVKDRAGIISFPKKGEQFRIITQESFNAYTMVLLVLKDSDIDEMYLATFNITEEIVRSIFDFLKKGKIKKLNLMMSESINFRMPKRIKLIHDLFEQHKHIHAVKVKLNWNHAKILLMKTKDDYLCVEGSGNLSNNAQIEQYTLDNNKNLYDFHKKWMEEAYEKKLYKREEVWT